ncbi:hypothetical protein TRICI_003705 [Trichomonascus ciferrii]|uniref:Integrase catalytic domain-containing protein n=1 Tax=Trichomonascus ciferrii TaxID=44093 RepID=A0A642V319_9ASCO|nr:hypothetical protein TRICI_003705 [Trichomonascus ciferrii]
MLLIMLSVSKGQENVAIDEPGAVPVKCVACIEGKASRPSFRSTEIKTTAPLQLIVSDLSGPYEHAIGNYQYFMAVIDDYSRFVEVFLLKKKSEAADCLLHFINQMHIKFKNNGDYRVGKVRSDNGGEYTSALLENELNKLLIDHQLTVPYTPEQNGIAERFNRTEREKAKKMMFHANLPKKFWGEAVLYATYVSNRVVHSSTGAVPLERFQGCDLRSTSGLNDLRVFGCAAYVMIPSERRRKLDKNVENAIFVGVDKNTKAYRVYTTDGTMKRKIAVTFDEHYFPAKMDWKFSRDADVIYAVAPYAPETDDPFYSASGFPLPLLSFSSPAPSISGGDETEGDTTVSGGEEDSAVENIFGEPDEPDLSVVKNPVLSDLSDDDINPTSVLSVLLLQLS